MAIPVIKKSSSTTWQFTSPAAGTSTPAELFAAASNELAKLTIMIQLSGVDISKGADGKYVLTLYFSSQPT